MTGAKRSRDQWEGTVIDLNVLPMIVLNIHHLQNQLSLFFSNSGWWICSHSFIYGNKLDLRKAAYLAQCFCC